MSSPAVTRKRSRANLNENNSSPATSAKLTPLSSKKRKLNTDGSSPVAASAVGSLARKLGGYLWGKSKEQENITNDAQDEDADELAEEDTPVSGRKKVGRPKKDVWDVPSSGAEDEVEEARTPRITAKQSESAKKSSNKTKSRAFAAVDELTQDDIWNVPTESPKRSLKKLTSSVERAKAILAPVEDESIPEPPRKRGRPRTSDLLRKQKKITKQAARDNLMAAGEKSDDEEDAPAPVKRRKGRESDITEELIEENIAQSTTKLNVVSARKRGRPRKTSVDILASTNLVPKGILTPSKNRSLKSRKSVAFEDVDEVDLGFRDLPNSAGAKESNSGKKATKEPTSEVETGETDVAEALEEEIASDESEEVSCGVCSGLDSKKKNPIILCDSCDFAVHLDCYQLHKVPKGDWFCRDCDPSTESGILFPQLDDLNTVEDTPNNLPDIDGFESHLRDTQRIILDKLTGQRRIKLQGYDEEMQKVHQVVEQTILAGEGNSMLVIGARGSGKTTLVESVISEMSSEHRQDFHVVRLNGFIHTDDKLALKEIWRQLGREMDAEEDFAGKSNYADTLASLLALLSHPSEMSESAADQTAKSVIFILDEFDLFTTHPRQTLLYNLFDIAQAKKAPIVVLGLTTRIDVIESLEKRVKSRFSHRYVYLSLAKSLPGFWDICKQGLLVNEEEIDSEIQEKGNAGQGEFVSFWTAMIEDLYSKDALFKHHLQSHFYRTKSVPELFTSCILPIANLTLKSFPLTGRKLVLTTSLSPPDSKLHLLQGLSELELALLIASARLDIILDTDTCNFAMAYDEYSSLTSRHKIQTSSTGVAALGGSAKVWGREVALGSWERLGEYGLLVPAGVGVGSARDVGAGGRMWKVDIGLEEIAGSVEGLNGVMSKWCREI